jgi:thiamine kinase-like enzyme
LRQLIQRLEGAAQAGLPPGMPALCRCDPNIRNFIRRPGAWASVDWENSGWGDPAYEIADLLTHPAYGDLLDDRQRWVIETYCERTGDTEVAARIAAYIPFCLVWWVARFTRSLYEVPRGLDERLAVRPPNWEAETRAKLDHYIERAETALRGLG